MTVLLMSGLVMVEAVQLGGTIAYRYVVVPSLFLYTVLAASASRVWAAHSNGTIALGRRERGAGSPGSPSSRCRFSSS
jgi:hypothetical protein